MSDIPSAIIADIYDAAIEPDGLEHIAESIGRYAGVEGAALILIRNDQPPESYSSTAIREQSHLYEAYYHKLDPWRPRGFMPGQDRLVLASELFPESKLIKTEFYADFARPMGMFRPISGYFDFGMGEMAAFGVEQPFSRRLFEPEDKARLQGLMPFLKRALTLRLRMKTAQQRSDFGLGALDALAMPVILCDSAGRIVHFNRAGAEQSDGTLPIGEVGKVIQVYLAEETERLHDLIRKAHGGTAGSLRLTRSDGNSVAAVATPIPEGEDGKASPGHVMITLRPESGVPSPHVAVLRSLYGLSPAQSDLCLALAAGMTFGEAAKERGIAVSTVRTHLASILERTGTRNLRDLLRLLGTLSAGSLRT